MNMIKYTVKNFPSDKTSILSGKISYQAALLIRRKSRFKISNKNYTVRDIEFKIANSKTNSETKCTIYMYPRFE